MKTKKGKIILGIIGAFIVIGAIGSLSSDSDVTEKKEPVAKEATQDQDIPQVTKNETVEREEISQEDKEQKDKEIAEFIMDNVVTPNFENSSYIIENEVMIISVYMNEAAMIGAIQDINTNNSELWDKMTDDANNITKNTSIIAASKGASFKVGMFIQPITDKDKVMYSTVNGIKVFNVKDKM